jgi:hypothetical protein
LPELRFGADIFLCGKQIEAQIPVRSRLRWVKANCIAIVACCRIALAQLSFGYPKQVLDGGIAWRQAMRLLQLDESLIEMAFSNQFYAVIQRGGLRVQ